MPLFGGEGPGSTRAARGTQHFACTVLECGYTLGRPWMPCLVRSDLMAVGTRFESEIRGEDAARGAVPEREDTCVCRRQSVPHRRSAPKNRMCACTVV